MKVSADFSHKMTVLSILATIAVVFIHSMAMMSNSENWTLFAANLVSKSLSRWSVPFFFVVSGFWFGRGKYVRDQEKCGTFLLNKIRTLLVPYLCWCVLGFVLSLPLILGNNLICHRGLWERTVIAIPGVWQKIDAFWGMTQAGPKTNMPLWFLRTLIVLFLLAPLWRMLLRIPFGRFLLPIISFVGLYVPGGSCPLLSNSSLCWFLVGLSLSCFSLEDWRVPTWAFLLALLFYILASVALALLLSSSCQLPYRDVLHDRLKSSVVPLFGMVFFWGLYDRVSFLKTFSVPWCVRQTFFIYCLHEIICSYQMSLARFVFGKTDCVTFFSTLVVPWLSFAFCAVAAWAVHRLSPRAYGVICGGR